MTKLTAYLAGWFRPKESDENQYYDDEPVEPVESPAPVAEKVLPAAPATTLITEVSRNAELPPQALETPKIEMVMPYWLEDEDMLRDEGVLFGLSESDPHEKTDIIQKYFSNLAAGHMADIEQQNDRIQELNLFIGQKTDRILELEEKIKNHAAHSGAGDHQLPRTLIGLSLCVVMCIGNFFLIRESLKPAFNDNSWIALGVFLAGMFSLFGKISLFHDSDSKVTWKSLLEEIGLPFAAALFVFAQVISVQPWWQAAALFIFVFFLFLFAGKLLLSNITVLRNDLQIWLGVRRDRHYSDNNMFVWENECQSLKQEIDELRVKKWQVLREQSHAETERERLYARRDMLIKLFESEFYLARRMKNELTSRQLNLIQRVTK